MFLAIDAGNTRIKWAMREAGAWLATGLVQTADAASLSRAIPADRAIDRVIVANVAGVAVRDAIIRLADGLGAPAEFIASKGAQCGVRSGYEDPAQLGCDRWASLIGARHLCSGACLVVNAGTALTVDALSDDGLFLGGIIAPGLDLMRRALDGYTAGLRLQPGAVRFFPANTGDAIMSGAAHALAGAVERMASFMRESGQEPLRVVLSGGGAEVLRPLLALEIVPVEHLVLEGLAVIAAAEC